MSKTRTMTSAMPKPSTIATGRRGRSAAPGEAFIEGRYSTWRKNPPIDFLQMRSANRQSGLFEGGQRRPALATPAGAPHKPPMPYSSLRDFIDRLEQSGRLARVKTAVSPALEMTEIQTRLLAERGPAVLFENVADAAGGSYAMPVLVNLFGTI